MALPEQPGGGGSFLLLLRLSWRGVLSEVRGGAMLPPATEAGERPVYLFNAAGEDIKGRGRGKVSCIWSASYG